MKEPLFYEEFALRLKSIIWVRCKTSQWKYSLSRGERRFVAGTLFLHEALPAFSKIFCENLPKFSVPDFAETGILVNRVYKKPTKQWKQIKRNERGIKHVN